MKTFSLISIFFLCIIQPLLAQTDSISPKTIYRTWITPLKKGPIQEGALFEVRDSSVILSNSYKKDEYRQGLYEVLKTDASSIEVIKLRKNHKVRNGILSVGVPVFTVGLTLSIASISSQDDKTTKGIAAFVSILCTTITTGLAVGISAAVGSIKAKYHIHGNQNQFDLYKNKLNKSSIIYNPDLRFKYFSVLHDPIVDIHGNVYHALALGGQVWMAENLKVTHYRDGSEIPGLTSNASGSGYQYNWVAVSHSINICPTGWHVPSSTEWTSLFNSLGGIDEAGRKLAETFSDTDKVCQWWSSTELDTVQAQSIYLNNTSIGVMFTNSAKSSGLSVRCIRDY